MKRCLTCKRVFNENGWKCSSCGWSPIEVSGFPAFESEVTEVTAELDHYPKDAYAKLYELEADSFWFRNRNKLIMKALAKNFPDATSLLDIGCGTGFVLSGIAAANPKLRLVGSDLHHEALGYAKERLPGVTLLQMDAGNIPYFEEFDVICAFDVLEHIPHDEVALRQIHQALNRGGAVMITVPQHPCLWSRSDDDARHLRRYTRRDLCRKLTDNGFGIIMVSSFISFLLPLLIISRLSGLFPQSIKQPINRQQSELHLHHSIDVLFETICSAENLLINRNLSFPIGGSLLCFAAKR
jgi:2-polyprenyl-3-methyl-5-hydroxy-6-metoxy-1,4-benzoquinol methylase